MKKLKAIFLKPWFLALLLSIIAIAVLPNLFDKYKIEVVDSGTVRPAKKTHIYSQDLNYDGYTEKIYSYEGEGKHKIQVFTSDGGIIDQWNPKGAIVRSEIRLVCGDFDEDKFDEIYTFYQRNDTIFLYCIEPMDTISQIFFHEKEICVLSHQYNEPDPLIGDLKMCDLNGDKLQELLFTIHSGKARFPRNLFRYDLATHEISISPDFGTSLATFDFVDFDGDNKLEIIGRTTAAGQVHDSLGYMYSDYSAWLMVFNHDLNLRFDPIEFPGFRSTLEIYPYISDTASLLVGFYNHSGPLTNCPLLFIANGDGDRIGEYRFNESVKMDRALRISNHEGYVRFNIINATGHIDVFSQELELVESIELEKDIFPFVKPFDLNNDGRSEWLFPMNDERLMITDDNFKHPVIIDYPARRAVVTSSLIKNGKNKPTLLLYWEDSFITLAYDQNPLAPIRFLVYLGIYLVIWSFILLIQKLQMIQIRKQEKIRNQIVDLQLKSYRNQMDPHFTFNVFNTMAAKIRKESPGSLKAFMEFSNLIRQTLLSSDSITRAIGDELSLLRSYLELEKLRDPKKIHYEIVVDKQVDQSIHMPKMVLQTYVENAIKHGLRHKSDGGTVIITLTTQNKNLLITISDDGVGREKAMEISTDSTGFGLRIMDNYFRLFNEYNVVKIKHKIIDLYDELNNPAGTRVQIFIPLNFSYKLKKHERR